MTETPRPNSARSSMASVISSSPQHSHSSSHVGRKPSVGKTKDSTPNTSKMLQKLHKEELKSVRSHTDLAQTANGVRMLTKNLAKATIQLHVRAIMIVTKARDNSLIYLTREVAEFLLSRSEGITVYVDSKLRTSTRFDAAGIVSTCPQAAHLLKFWNKRMITQNPERFDLCITLGGDGTVLHVSNMFQTIVPPVISFALGSLGFLTNFRFEHFRKRMTTVLETGVRAYMRMRFTCRVYTAENRLVTEQQVLNELVVDRGPSPYVTNLELYGDGSLLTVAQADGLIIATPTGSTAYSLSAGGSLVHPGVSAISVTPICPHTLSFRPILLPDGMLLKVKVPASSRATAWASFDGKVRTELKKGYYVIVQASSFPFPTVRSSKTEYFDSVSRNLNWNAREQQKPFSSYLTGNTKSAFEKKHNPNDIAGTLAELASKEDGFDIDYSDPETDGGEYNESKEELPTGELDEESHYDHTVPYFSVHENGEGSSVGSFVDNRTCYAHPNATVSLHGDSAGTPDTIESELDRLEF
ncbi:hypothetical protein JCM33374_g4972 [Metschnikowia sp. JCM 33374]|nr:hypothetical protein JCM33374_g4972 [Metschnikowia sp. JCM 33374]